VDFDYPLVSIITPSYNSGKFIEETILSIINQSYKRIEYIIIDGKSTDNTIDIIKKYEKICSFRSESDFGQSEAINKGWLSAKGDILAYINADDTYFQETVEIVVNYFRQNPDVMMIYGDFSIIDINSKKILFVKSEQFDLKKLICLNNFIGQPTVFFRKEIIKKIGLLDTNLHYVMDLDFWIRIGSRYKIVYIPKNLANFRIHAKSKTISEGYHKSLTEHIYILNKVFLNSNLPSELKSLKKMAYASAYYYAGRGYLRHHNIKDGLHYLIRAFYGNRRIFFDFYLFQIFLMLILGENNIKKTAKWMQRKFNLFKNIYIE